MNSEVSMDSSQVFQHLSSDYVQKRYEELKAEGRSEDDIFTELYSEDCNLDEEQ